MVIASVCRMVATPKSNFQQRWRQQQQKRVAPLDLQKKITHTFKYIFNVTHACLRSSRTIYVTCVNCYMDLISLASKQSLPICKWILIRMPHLFIVHEMTLSFMMNGTKKPGHSKVNRNRDLSTLTHTKEKSFCVNT